MAFLLFMLLIAPGQGDVVETLLKLFSDLRQYVEDQSPADRSVGFDLPQEAINLYLNHLAAGSSRPGLRDVAVELLAGGSIRFRVTISGDALRDWSQNFRSASGDVTLQGTARADCRDSYVRLAFHSVRATKDEFNEALARDALRLLAANQPEHFDLDKPLRLPFGLKRMEVSRGLLRGSDLPPFSRPIRSWKARIS